MVYSIYKATVDTRPISRSEQATTMRAACEDHKTGIVCQAIEKESGVDATEKDVYRPCSNAYSTGAGDQQIQFVTLQNVSPKGGENMFVHWLKHQKTRFVSDAFLAHISQFALYRGGVSC